MQLYPLLARLERDGLIHAQLAADDERPSRRTARAYAITEAGRARFYELMLDIVSSIGEYQRLFRLKVPHLEFLSQDEQVQLLEHYRDYCRTAVRHQERITHELEERLRQVLLSSSDTAQATPAGITNGLATTRYMIAQWQAELAWVEQLLKEVVEPREQQ